MARKTADKFYDIAKATPLVTVEKTFGNKFGENPDDDWTETLYIKPTGEYFVYGQGGKNSPFSVDENGETLPGSRYEVWVDYNYNNAKNWVHTNCPDKQKEIFMAAQENDKKTVTTIMLTTKAKINLRRKAKEQGTSVSELIQRWAEKFYE